MRELQRKLSIASGERPAEPLFKNARLVNVLSGEVYRTHVAVDDGRVVGLGDYKAKQVIDLKGAYLAPSLIDGHFHVESSMLTTREFECDAVYLSRRGSGGLSSHPAALEAIERATGVLNRYPDAGCYRLRAALAERHGALVDREKKIVKVKGDLIEEALAKCPSAYPLAARDPQQDLSLDGNHVYLGTDGCGVEVIDLHTGQKRTSCLGDVRDIARVADATEEVAFHWVPVSAQDMPPENRGLYEIRTIWENSTKHVQTESIYSVHEAQAAMEMAALMVGGKDRLKERPDLSLMQCTAPPLGHDGGSLDAALIAAEHGIPTPIPEYFLFLPKMQPFA